MTNIMWKMKDKEHSLHELETALNMVGIGISYEGTMLIKRVFEEYAKKGGQFAISDAVALKEDHERMVDEYYVNQNKQ